MGEASPKFVAYQEEFEENSILSEVKQLRNKANSHEDFNKTVAFMDKIADFNKELLLFYDEDAIRQVPLYHELIGSGMSDAIVFEEKILPELQVKIEKTIESFIKDELLKTLED